MQNWGGTHTYEADLVVEPGSLDELADVLRGAGRVRPAGTRHTFTAISDSPVMVGVGGLGERFDLDAEAGTVTIDGAMTYRRLTELLDPHRLAVPNLASLVDLSVAGAVATATHGSGDDRGCLSTAVVGLELMTADGELRAVRAGDAEFGGLVVGLGAAGVVTALTLRLEPAAEMSQRVYVDLGLDVLADSVDEVFASGTSVSVFTGWTDVAQQVWVKQRVDAERSVAAAVAELAMASDDVHPVPGLDASACTAQGGRPGPWWARLPHFRRGSMPNAGHEIQSEYFVPREVGAEAIRAVRSIGAQLAPVLMTSELRTIKADDLWLSPFSGRDSLAFHFTWHPDVNAVGRAAAAIEAALAPFEPRPHWGKVFTPGFSTVHPTARRPEAVDLFASLDPRRVFVNPWLQAEGLRA